MYTSFVLEPPYAQAVRLIDDTDPVLPRGAMLLLQPEPADDPRRMISALHEWRRRCPHVPVILWLHELSAEAALQLAISAAASGFHGVIAGPSPSADTLRGQLLDPAHVGHDVVQWLRSGGLPVDHIVGRFFEAALGESRYVKSLTDLLGACALSYATLHRAAARSRLGSPGNLRTLLRSLSAAIELQREPRTTAAVIAGRYGFWDDAALRRHLRDDLGTSPTYVRAMIGWQPLLAAALRRTGHSFRPHLQ